MREALAAEPTLGPSLRATPLPPLLAPLGGPGLSPSAAVGLDLILEGFLLHHGTPRQLAIPDRGRQVLAGDYCYAAGLVRVALAGELFMIEALSSLIAAGAGLAARGDHAALAPLWRGTVRAIAGVEPGLQPRYWSAATALERGEPSEVERLAAELGPTPGLEEALRG